jgi:hypothetical protein
MTVLGAWIDTAGEAHAMSAFARKLNMKCSACHTAKIPELNQFGIDFYRNGFTVMPRDEFEALKAKTAAGGAAKPVQTIPFSQQKVDRSSVVTPPASATPPATSPDDDEAEEIEDPLTPPEPPRPTVVYRSQGRDGTLHFTDNPQRQAPLEVAPERATKQKPPQRVAAPKKRAVARAADVHQKRGTTQATAPPTGERFQSYEACMEGQLVATPPPGTAHEAMALFMDAERRCAAYQVEKR